MERLHHVAKTYGQLPHQLVESEDWTKLRRFRFDEAVLIAGANAERRANDEARREAEESNNEAPRSGLSAHGPDRGGVQSGSGNARSRVPEIDMGSGEFIGGVIPFIGKDG